MISKNLTQELGILAHVSAGSTRAAGSYASEAVDASKFGRLVGLLNVGTLAGAATASLRFQHNSVSTGSDSGWSDVNSDSCITSAHASGDNGKLAALELRLDQNPSTARFVRALVSAVTSTWNGAAQVFGHPPRYSPASDYNSDDVAAITVF